MPRVTWVGLAMAGVIMAPGVGGCLDESRLDVFGYLDISAN